MTVYNTHDLHDLPGGISIFTCICIRVGFTYSPLLLPVRIYCLSPNRSRCIYDSQDIHAASRPWEQLLNLGVGVNEWEFGFSVDIGGILMI